VSGYRQVKNNIQARPLVPNVCVSMSTLVTIACSHSQCRARLSGCHVSTIGKKLVKQQYLLHMSSQCGELSPLTAETGSGVWGTPANFSGFRVLAALLHGTPELGVSQTLHC